MSNVRKRSTVRKNSSSGAVAIMSASSPSVRKEGKKGPSSPSSSSPLIGTTAGHNNFALGSSANGDAVVTMFDSADDDEDELEGCLSYVDFHDLGRFNDFVIGKHILKKRKRAFAKPKSTQWIVPHGRFEVSEELVNQFCQTHRLTCVEPGGKGPPTIAEITDATALLKKFFRTRDRINEALRYFNNGLRIAKRVVEDYVKRRRKLLESYVVQWEEGEIEKRDALRERISSRILKLKPLKKVSVEAIKKRKSIMAPEEAEQFTAPLIPKEEKYCVVKSLYRKAYARYHRKWKRWQKEFGAQEALLRRKTIQILGSILSLPEVLHQAGIPHKPQFSFHPTEEHIEREYHLYKKHVAEMEQKQREEKVKAMLAQKFTELSIFTFLEQQQQKAAGGEESFSFSSPLLLEYTRMEEGAGSSSMLGGMDQESQGEGNAGRAATSVGTGSNSGRHRMDASGSEREDPEADEEEKYRSSSSLVTFITDVNVNESREQKGRTSDVNFKDHEKEEQEIADQRRRATVLADDLSWLAGCKRATPPPMPSPSTLFLRPSPPSSSKQAAVQRKKVRVLPLTPESKSFAKEEVYATETPQLTPQEGSIQPPSALKKKPKYRAREPTQEEIEEDERKKRELLRVTAEVEATKQIFESRYAVVPANQLRALLQEKSKSLLPKLRPFPIDVQWNVDMTGQWMRARSGQPGGRSAREGRKRSPFASARPTTSQSVTTGKSSSCGGAALNTESAGKKGVGQKEQENSRAPAEQNFASTMPIVSPRSGVAMSAMKAQTSRPPRPAMPSPSRLPTRYCT